jgi:hypothetical protein
MSPRPLAVIGFPARVTMIAKECTLFQVLSSSRCNFGMREKYILHRSIINDEIRGTIAHIYTSFKPRIGSYVVGKLFETRLAVY